MNFGKLGKAIGAGVDRGGVMMDDIGAYMNKAMRGAENQVDDAVSGTGVKQGDFYQGMKNAGAGLSQSMNGLKGAGKAMGKAKDDTVSQIQKTLYFKRASRELGIDFEKLNPQQKANAMRNIPQEMQEKIMGGVEEDMQRFFGHARDAGIGAGSIAGYEAFTD